MRRKPRGYRLDILACRAKLLPKLNWSKPPVIIGRSLILLFGHQLCESRFLLGTALQDELHALHRKLARCRAAVKLRLSERMGVAVQHGQFGIIHYFGDARRYVIGLGQRTSGEKTQTCNEGQHRNRKLVFEWHSHYYR